MRVFSNKTISDTMMIYFKEKLVYYLSIIYIDHLYIYQTKLIQFNDE